MHDSIQYDLIQCQGLETFKVGNPANFKSYHLLRHIYNGSWQLTTGS